jgi:hypothetical protein
MVACPPDGEDAYSTFDAKDATYRDNVKFHSTNEPAIDLTAPSLLMFAWRVAGAPATTSLGASPKGGNEIDDIPR